MKKTIAFLAETPGSPTIASQKLCLTPDDIQIFAGKKTFHQLAGLLARQGIRLASGDRIKIHDLSCLSLTTAGVIRAVARLLKAGVSVELCSPPVVIEPRGEDKLHALFDALDAHSRHIHGIKTHPPKMAQAGRKRLLDPDQLPDIRAKLGEPGATTSTVAESLGVARATLFNYLERYDVDRRLGRQKKGIDRSPQGSGDAIEIPGPDPDRTAI